MSNLKRIQVGNFNIKDAISLEELETQPEKHLIQLENNQKLKLFLNGVRLTYSLEEGIYRIYNQEKFIGTGVIQNNLLKRDIII